MHYYYNHNGTNEDTDVESLPSASTASNSRRLLSLSFIHSSEILDSPSTNHSYSLMTYDSGSDIPDTDFLPLSSGPQQRREVIPERESFAFSSSYYNTHTSESASGSGSNGAAAGAMPVFPRGSIMERNIEAVSGLPGVSEHKTDYKGRYRIWPGVLFLLVVLIGAAVAITFSAMSTYSASVKRQEAYAIRKADGQSISGGNSSGSLDDIVSDDGEVGNPKSYPASACELPDYQSKNGKIYAVAANGTEVAIGIKGANWFGMETGNAIPFGLWDNNDNGTTAYQIATFLAEQKFNAVRLPLCIQSINENTVPNTGMINTAENRAIDVTDYMSLLKSIIKVLQYRNIGVLLSLHTLTPTDSGSLWYSDEISEDDFLDAVDTLTSNLCDMEYYNIMGLDVKNEPYDGTWGDDSDTDFKAGAEKIANRMLTGCSSWMAFVEGINADHTVTIDGEDFDYYDWYGGGLQKAGDNPPEFDVEHKLVYAPHYYTPAVYPQAYFFDGGTRSGSMLLDYVELDDDTLKARVAATIDDMCGYLASNSGPAILLGEFAGLYATDLHPKLTTQRCTDFTIDVIKGDNWSGGFMWSLNPESAYEYNPSDTEGSFTEGLLEDDWLEANTVFLEGMAAMDDLPNLVSFPCFPTTASSSGSSSS